jgi:hypothetical protein
MGRNKGRHRKEGKKIKEIQGKEGEIRKPNATVTWSSDG